MVITLGYYPLITVKELPSLCWPDFADNYICIKQLDIFQKRGHMNAFVLTVWGQQF